MSLGFLDLLVVFLVGISAFRGFRRGFIREGMALGGLALGLVLATRYHQSVASLLRPFIGGGRLPDALAFLLVVLTALLCATLLTVLLRPLVKSPLGSQLDRLGGALFGAALGALLVAAVLFLAVKYQVVGLGSAVQGSDLGRGMVRSIPVAASYLPPEFPSVAGFFRLQ